MSVSYCSWDDLSQHLMRISITPYPGMGSTPVQRSANTCWPTVGGDGERQGGLTLEMVGPPTLASILQNIKNS